MNMLDLINISDKHWIKIVEQSSGATVFHHPFWSTCLSQSYGYCPFVAVMKSSDDLIHAGLPVMEINSWLTSKRWVALPFSDHCSPLLQNKDDLEVFASEMIR